MKQQISIPAQHEKRLGRYLPIIQKYANLIARHFGDRLVSICVFGSVATGRSNKESDIDILVIAEGLPPDFGERTEATSHIHTKLGDSREAKALRRQGYNTFVSNMLLTPEEAKSHPPLFLDITEEGVMLYDKGQFLEKELAAIKTRLQELGAQKVKVRGKGHYWILKPDLKPGEAVEI
ncbi:MAG: nucleotidyltransferase domain-containing protein [Chloroflexi bacterium]|nr:nucleotidyltransferase domain-containing protein [Chloroflexota bacterium]